MSNNPFPTVEDMWTSFYQDVVSKDAGPVQVMEMRKTFYAGVGKCLQVLYEVGDDAKSVQDEIRAADYLESLWKEVEDWIKAEIKKLPEQN